MALERPTSEVGVANLALEKCNEDEIATFDDDVNRARVVRRHFGLVRDALLRRLDWNWAVMWTVPAADAVASAGEFTVRFPMPGNCIAVREVFAGATKLGDDEWAIEGGSVSDAGVDVEAVILVCNQASVRVHYTKKVTDPRVWDPLFMDAFVCELAAAIAPGVGKSTSKANAFKAEAEELLLPLAKRTDSKEKAPSKVGAQKLPSWLAARGMGWRRSRTW